MRRFLPYKLVFLECNLLGRVQLLMMGGVVSRDEGQSRDLSVGIRRTCTDAYGFYGFRSRHRVLFNPTVPLVEWSNFVESISYV